MRNAHALERRLAFARGATDARDGRFAPPSQPIAAQLYRNGQRWYAAVGGARPPVTTLAEQSVIQHVSDQLGQLSAEGAEDA